ncbi:C4-dicarboxylate TRAP transporter substrate-binding protein [Oscillospiraceae bacterium LTW-04]|nr:C4-dicarboxylate TRAP transporter substrate-binding protein [Oscillospiraceae bacterium MB24-C1]
MKRTLTLVLAAVMVLSLVACGTSGASSTPSSAASASSQNAAGESAEKASMSFANTQPEADVETQALFECETQIEAATNGNFAIEVYPNSSMGDTDDLLEQAIEGAAVLTITDPGRLADYIPEYGILQMPYFMPDYTYINPVTSTDKVKEWEAGFEEFGVKVLTSNWYGGTRHFVCNTEVNVPADLNGLKIRTMGSDLCIQSVNAMGAVGTAMSQSEIYSGIEQKAIDGCENQNTSTYAMRLYEIQSYINKTGHFILLGTPAMGTTYFNSLSAENQQLLVDTFTKVGTDYQKICVEQEAEFEKEMKEKGMTINEIDTTPFKEAVQPVYTQLGYDTLRDEIYAEIGLS